MRDLLKEIFSKTEEDMLFGTSNIINWFIIGLFKYKNCDTVHLQRLDINETKTWLYLLDTEDLINFVVKI